MRERKTADALLDREEWQAIRDWLLPQMGNTRGLQLNPEAAAPIRAVDRKERKTSQWDNIAIRLPRDQMETLREQMSFWEACQDELRAVCRGGMPNPYHFLGITQALEYGLWESENPSRPAPAIRCQACGKPLGKAGTVQVGIDQWGRTYAVGQHPECAAPAG